VIDPAHRPNHPLLQAASVQQGGKTMKFRKAATIGAIAVFATLAAATPARAASICSISPDTSYYAWFAWTFGYCRSYNGD
jgi:hypothetical protein